MSENLIGPHSGSLTDVDSTQRNPLGTIVKSDDFGEYIYLKGITSTAAKDWVTYDETFATARLAQNAVGKVAVAMAAVDANTKFGWYCIKSPSGGKLTAGADAVSDNKALYIDATTVGAVDDASVAGDLIKNAFSRAAITAAGDLLAEFDHPYVDDTVS